MTYNEVTGVDVNVTLSSPNTGTWQTTQSVVFQFNATADNSTLLNCSVYTNASGSWIISANNSTAIANVTGTNITFDFGADTNIFHLWNTECYNSNNESAFASSNRTLKIDSTGPTTVDSTLLNSTRTASSFVLDWVASTDAGIGGTITYMLFRDGVNVANYTDSNCTQSGLSSGTTYQYIIGTSDSLYNYGTNSTAVYLATDTGGGGGAGGGGGGGAPPEPVEDEEPTDPENPEDLIGENFDYLSVIENPADYVSTSMTTMSLLSMTGGDIVKYITLTNTESKTVILSLVPNTTWVSVEPSRYSMESNESKTFTITISQPPEGEKFAEIKVYSDNRYLFTIPITYNYNEAPLFDAEEIAGLINQYKYHMLAIGVLLISLYPKYVKSKKKRT